jgi:hypothetical protein
MVNLFHDFREFLESLNLAKVEYLVLGGYAVIHYGYERTTGDLDVWVATTSKNARRISRVLQDFFGYPPEAVDPEQFREWGKAFILGRKPVRIDILTGPTGVVFNECYKRRKIVDWDGVKVPLIALSDLKANKLASARAKDLADVENLPERLPDEEQRKGRRAQSRRRK